MGKASILQHLGDGLYSILYQPDKAFAQARVTELETQKTALDALYLNADGLSDTLAAALIVYNDATAAFEAALDDWGACAREVPPCPDMATFTAVISQRGAARAEAGQAVTGARAAIAQNRADYFAATQEIAYLAATANTSADGVVMRAWSADYDPARVLDPSTVVGTIETYGARGDRAGGWLPRAHINIQPTDRTPAYNLARDRCVRPISSQPLAASLYNYLQWLFVMSRNPLHAVATVTGKYLIGGPGTLDVQLLGNTPGGIQPSGYPFDRTSFAVDLANVPVDYLTCGAGAFEIGDRVIVRFADLSRTGPTVIGFAENPRDCGVTLMFRRAMHTSQTYGTVADGADSWLKTSPTCEISTGKVAYTEYGVMDWISADKNTVLTLDCMPGALGDRPVFGGFIAHRYSPEYVVTLTPPDGYFERERVFKTGVGHNGKPFLDLSGCVGVARKNNYLLYVVRTFERIDPFSENDIKTTFSLLAIAADWSASTTSGAPILLASGEHSITDNFDIKSAQGLFVFNPEASDGMGICGTMQVMRATIGWDADTGTPLGTLSVESVPYVDIEAFSQKIVAVDYVAGVATYMVLSTYTTGLVRVYGDPFYCTNDGTPEGVILAEAQNFSETATEIRNLAANGVTVDAYTYELTATVVYTFNAECDTTFTRSESLSITGGWQLIAADMRGGVYYIRQHDGAIQENGAPICSIPDLSSYTGVAAFSEYGPGVLAASIYDNSVEGVLTHMDTITRLRCNGEFSDATGLLGTVGAIDTTGITTDYLGDIWGAHLPLYRLGVIRYQALPA